MTLAGASILIVDDEPVLRLTFSVLMKKAGATVLTASDGLQALDVLAAHHVDALLVDRQMPNMDGMTLLRTLADRGTLYPSLLFINGIEPEDLVELRRIGVAETVTKPLHPRDLIQAFERVLEPLKTH